jgi:hypothetical protein
MSQRQRNYIKRECVICNTFPRFLYIYELSCYYSYFLLELGNPILCPQLKIMKICGLRRVYILKGSDDGV